jgi:hypothetical protein
MSPNKTKRVIESCKTKEQLIVACNYTQLALDDLREYGDITNSFPQAVVVIPQFVFSYLLIGFLFRGL